MLAFVFSPDTAKAKVYDLYLWSTGKAAPEKLFEREILGLPLAWSVSEHGAVYFSEHGDRLYFGVAPNQVPEPKDTSRLTKK